MTSRILASTLIVLCLLPITEVTANTTTKEKEAALQQVQSTQKQLDQDELNKNNELAQLRQLELERLTLEAEMDQLETSLNLSKSTYASLNTVNEKFRDQMDNQSVLLEKIAVLSYVHHQESPLKILFHVDDIDIWYRNLAYYGYTTGYQLSKLKQIDDSLKIQEKLLQELVQTRKTIEQQHVQLDQRLAQLTTTEQERQRVLQTLANRIQKGEKQLVQLNDQLARIDKLTIDLGELQPDELFIYQVGFRSLRGQLPLPTKGKVKFTYNTKATEDITQQSTLHHKGVVIETEYGSPVQAIAEGNVVFSDWVRGFGLVVILDHGDEFLSLYAHNRQIAARTGDWVKAGDLISYVGETGGRTKPQLYIELRHKTVPLNPAIWLAHHS